MQSTALAGNARLKEQLLRQEQGRGLSHAYLISGPGGSGRHLLARRLAAAMVCAAPAEHRPCGRCAPCKKVFGGVHPDVSVISGPGEDKPITVDQVRALRSDAYVRPNEGQRKVYVLEGADRMNSAAQNAMLKLLEEGPEYAAFLLLAENGGGVLQTVRSRCEELAMTPVPLGECEAWLRENFPDQPPETVRQAALDCQGILGRAVRALSDDDPARQEREQQVRALADALEKGTEPELFERSMVLEQGKRETLGLLLDESEQELGRRLVLRQDRRRLLRAVELVRTLRAAAQLNANPGQLAGWLCAGLFESTPAGR